MPDRDPPKGRFVLYQNVLPALKAGAYDLDTSLAISGGGQNVPVSPLQSTFRVTAPRFVMPRDQILSTYPPNQASGAFSLRLPQVVLRRRTLPWERIASEQSRETPWMTLVLLADGEGELHPDQEARKCLTPGVILPDSEDDDSPTATALIVTQRVVKEVFPAGDELPLLTHVRRVNLNDTELAMGDDDGWLAVVVSNRLPQPGVRYRACLISVEGQLKELGLAKDRAAEESFEETFVYPDWPGVLDDLARDRSPSTDRTPSLTHSNAGAWSPTFSAPHSEVLNAIYRRADDAGGFHRVPADYFDPGSRLLRFPVLAHWTFTCSEGGDFQSRMSGLDVGLIGKLADSSKKKPIVLDTGHVDLRATHRTGDAARVWYRGPLTARVIARQQRDSQGRLALHHVSEQAIRNGREGREDLSHAAAFEIGRLLALADPSFVSDLLLWRRSGFELAQRRSQLERLPNIALNDSKLAGRGLSYLIGRRLLTALGKNKAKQLGPLRPIVAGARPIDLGGRNPLQALQKAFGVPMQTLQAILRDEEGVALDFPQDLSLADRFEDLLADDWRTLFDALDRVRSNIMNGV